jgi:hypothetical protein
VCNRETDREGRDHPEQDDRHSDEYEDSNERTEEAPDDSEPSALAASRSSGALTNGMAASMSAAASTS